MYKYIYNLYYLYSIKKNLTIINNVIKIITYQCIYFITIVDSYSPRHNLGV